VSRYGPEPRKLGFGSQGFHDKLFVKNTAAVFAKKFVAEIAKRNVQNKAQKNAKKFAVKSDGKFTQELNWKFTTYMQLKERIGRRSTRPFGRGRWFPGLGLPIRLPQSFGMLREGASST
jgi:hypothetical protein